MTDHADIIKCECSDEYGPCEDHGTVLAQYEGASTRTADELTYIYVLECFTILGQDLTPVAQEIMDAVAAAGGDSGWIDTGNQDADAELSDALRDLAWQMESTIGAWTFWDDGFRIVEPSEDCPLV